MKRLNSKRLRGKISANTQNALGQLISRTGAGSVPVFYQFDAVSRMTNLVDGVGNTTLFDYSADSQLEKKTYADGSFYLYRYNARGWLTNRVDGLGTTTVYRYSDIGQLTNVHYQTDGDIYYLQDILGRMTSRTDKAGTWTWTYDGDSSRVTSESLSSAYSASSAVSYSYDSTTKQLASMSCGDAYRIEYTWQNGRLTDLRSIINGLTNDFAYSYMADMNLVAGVSNAVLWSTKTYDLLGPIALT
jgi:YD repeat-containing protein